MKTNFEALLWLKEELKRRKWTVAALAGSLDYTERYMHKILAGDRGLNYETAHRILEVIQFEAAGRQPYALWLSGEGPRPHNADEPEKGALPPYVVPIPSSQIVGRREELKRLKRLVKNNRLVTLLGIGGGGKTRLAIEVTLSLRHDFSDGIYFIEVDKLPGPDWLADDIAKKLGVQAQPGQAIREALLEHLRPRNALLVFDGCEHMKDTCQELVNHLIGGSSRLHILATSREVLEAQDEQIMIVEPLQLGDARELFKLRAKRASEDFEKTADNDLIDSICRRVSGLPLAIMLAAGRALEFDLQLLSKQLDGVLWAEVDAGEAADWRKKETTITASIAWSYVKLSPSEKRLFQRLSVFVGGWTAEACMIVCADPSGPIDDVDGTDADRRYAHDVELGAADRAGDSHVGGTTSRVLTDLGRLVKNSLVQRHADRYSMLEILRHYAQHHLNRSGEGDVIRRRRVRFFVAIAAEAAPAMRGREQARWLRHLEAEHANLRAALEWCRNGEPEDLNLGLELATKLHWSWEMTRMYAEGHRHLKGLLLASSESMIDLPAALHVQALIKAARLAWRRGDRKEATDLLAPAWTIAQETRSDKLIADVQLVRGVVAGPRGREDIADAKELYKKMGEAGEQGYWDATYQLYCTPHVGVISGISYAAAMRHLESAFDWCLNQRDLWGQGCALLALSDWNIWLWQHDLHAPPTGDRVPERDDSRLTDAAAQASKAVELFEEVGDPWGVAHGCRLLAYVRFYQAAYDEMIEAIEKTLEHSLKPVDYFSVAECVVTSAKHSWVRGEAELAAKRFGAAAYWSELAGGAPRPRSMMLHNKDQDELRQELGQEGCERVLLEGKSIARDKSVEDALRALEMPYSD